MVRLKFLLSTVCAPRSLHDAKVWTLVLALSTQNRHWWVLASNRSFAWPRSATIVLPTTTATDADVQLIETLRNNKQVLYVCFGVVHMSVAPFNLKLLLELSVLP